MKWMGGTPRGKKKMYYVKMYGVSQKHYKLCCVDSIIYMLFVMREFPCNLSYIYAYGI